MASKKKELKAYKLLFPKSVNVSKMYNSLNMAFAYCSEPTTKSTVTLRSHFYTCRESHANALVHRMRHTSNSVKGDPDINKISLKFTRLIISNVYARDSIPSHLETKKKELLEKVGRGVNILNIFEKRNKWRLTKMFDIKHDGHQRGMFVMVIGDKKWQRSTHMMSLFTLMLRLGEHKTFNAKNYTELIKQLDTFSKTSKNDSFFVRKTYLYWDKLMKEFNNLFKGLSMQKNYSMEVVEDQFSEGIRILCDGSSENDVLSKRFKRLCQ